MAFLASSGSAGISNNLSACSFAGSSASEAAISSRAISRIAESLSSSRISSPVVMLSTVALYSRKAATKASNRLYSWFNLMYRFMSVIADGSVICCDTSSKRFCIDSYLSSKGYSDMVNTV